MVGVRRHLVRISRLLFEPFFGDVVPVCKFELPLGDAEPSRLLLHVTTEGGGGGRRRGEREKRRSGDV